MNRIALVLVLSTSLLLAAHERAASNIASSGIVATFDVVGETFRAHIENPTTIQQVLALQQGQSTATIPVGALRPGEEYNTGWSWHTDPWEIEMAEVAIELCDGRPSYVEAELDYWLNTVGTYCPWSAALVDVAFLGVGGVAELPRAPSQPLDTPTGRPGLSPGALASLAAGAAGGASVAAAGVWYARRRPQHQAGRSIGRKEEER